MIIVGSTALEVWGLNRSTPKDVDRWFYEEADRSRAGKEDDYVMPSRIFYLVPVRMGFATPNAIYTIKCSHLAWDIKWEKTKNDILWLTHKGCELIPELYHALKDHWQSVHGDKSFLSLKKDKDEFFDDHVAHIYNHDWLHEVVASPNKPMYESCLQEGEQVLVDKDKFDAMPFANRVRMFREEISVIALERWVLNNHWKGKVGWYEAYGLALKKTITNLTKNWANDFIVQNLAHFNTPDWGYFKNAMRIEENLMGNVDKQYFEELVEKLGVGEDLDEMVVEMATGEFDPYPEWTYTEATKKAEETVKEEFGDWRDLPYGDPVKARAMAKFFSLRTELKAEYCKQVDESGELPVSYKHLMQEGGGEGGSEYCEGVFELDGKCYHVSWSYASHCGFDTDDAFNTLKEVTPKEKTITVYE